jgi:hypothetical protein
MRISLGPPPVHVLTYRAPEGNHNRHIQLFACHREPVERRRQQQQQQQQQRQAAVARWQRRRRQQQWHQDQQHMHPTDQTATAAAPHSAPQSGWIRGVAREVHPARALAVVLVDMGARSARARPLAPHSAAHACAAACGRWASSRCCRVGCRWPLLRGYAPGAEPVASRQQLVRRTPGGLHLTSAFCGGCSTSRR